jgi:hypothetical protein
MAYATRQSKIPQQRPPGHRPAAVDLHLCKQ